LIKSYVEHHQLGLKLRSVLVGELFLAKKLRSSVYVFKDGIFLPILQENTVPSKEHITGLISSRHKEVYVHQDDFHDIKDNLKNALVKITRSLSVGDPLVNGTKELKLLSLNLNGLYQNPHNDQLLMLQFQSSQNLSKFLIENKKHQSQYFQSLLKENFHFTLVQPMLSSLLLLSFLQSIHLFHEKEIENLFLASYLKDLGISMIPEDKYDIKNLSGKNQELFANHAVFSFDLLDGRIPLSKNYLHIIKNHHFLNDKLKGMINKRPYESEEQMLMGIESTLVGVFDILVAMTSERPYRKPLSFYQALEVIKKMMADDYPQEFKALVIFLKQFFKN
jgi:hypothetical protein